MPRLFASIRLRTALFSSSAQPYGRRKTMSYLSLLYTPATQGLSNAPAMSRETEREVHTAPDTVKNTFAGTGSGASNYQLPSGIVSLDHWLDLNA
jgi:hypothetical protein